MNTFDELQSNTKLRADVNSSVPDLWHYFDNITSSTKVRFTDKNIDDRINDVFQNFIRIIDLVPLMASFVSIPQIVRGRPNYNGEVFTCQTEISYNTSCPERIAFGRFNQKHEPLFYGSLPTETQDVDYVLSCALECCKELTAESTDIIFQDITVGGWLVNESFPVINLCFDDDHLKENPSLAVEVRRYLDTIDGCFSTQAANFIKAFLHYFSNLSGTLCDSDYHYFTTTALFHAIRWYYESKAKEPKYGLIYPGAMSEKKGLNIVLTSDAVDKFLSLDKVVMYRYHLVRPEKTTYVAYPVSDMVRPRNGIFHITNYNVINR